jgi:peptidoglycan L-alanyl-D-glutamate endopeptidase CwlK
MITDLMTEARLMQVFPELGKTWRQIRAEMWELHQVQIRVTEGLRSFEKQLEDWSKGREKVDGAWKVTELSKVVTHAPPGQSAHQFGLGVDTAFMGEDPYLAQMDPKKAEFLWNEYGRLAISHGLDWGGSWEAVKRDRPHVENLYRHRMAEIRNFYEVGGLAAVWTNCSKNWRTLC